MPKSPEGGYVPSPEEVKKAEEMMTPEEENASWDRAAEFIFEENFDSKETAEMLDEVGMEAARYSHTYFMEAKNGKKAVVNVYMKAGRRGFTVQAFVGSQGELDNHGTPSSFEKEMWFEPIPPKTEIPEGKKAEDLTLEEKKVLIGKRITKTYINALLTVKRELEREE